MAVAFKGNECYVKVPAGTSRASLEWALKNNTAETEWSKPLTVKNSYQTDVAIAPISLKERIKP